MEKTYIKTNTLNYISQGNKFMINNLNEKY